VRAGSGDMLQVEGQLRMFKNIQVFEFECFAEK